MKKSRLILALMTAMLSIGANATVIDGINYDLKSTKQASVMKLPSGLYTSVSIVIPEEVTYEDITYQVTGISGHAFENCQKIESVSLPHGLKTIGDFAFSGCTKLQSIDLPSTLTSIGSEALDWTGITYLSIPDGCSVESYAFMNCKSLKEVHLPYSLTAIPQGAFWGDEAIEEIYCYSSTVPTVALEAFDNVNPMVVYVPVISESAYKIADGWSAFASVIQSQIKGVEIDDIVYDLNIIDGDCYVGDNTSSELTEVVIPQWAKYEGKSYYVRGINAGAFEQNKNIETLNIQADILEIGNYAFDKCTYLKTIVLPASLLSIGKYAFRATKNLELLISNNNVAPFLNTDGFSFDASNNKANVYVPVPAYYNSDAEWSGYFTNIKGIAEFKPEIFVDGIKYSLDMETQRATVIRPSSTDPVYTGDIVIPEKVEYLAQSYDVTNIGDQVFGGIKVTSVFIPKSVFEIHIITAFSNAINIKTITVDPDNSVYASQDGVLFSKDMTSLFVYPYAAPTSYTIPDGVTEIYMDAFANGKIAELTMPASMEKIGPAAFYDCTKLTKIVCLAENAPQLSEYAFKNVSAEVRVPMSSIAAYQVADGWKDLTILTEADGLMDGINYHFDAVTNTAKVIALPSGLYSGELNIPAKVTFENVDFDVTAIGKEACKGCTELTSLVLPATVSAIEENAFDDCTALKKILCYSLVSPAISAPGAFANVDKKIPVYVYLDALTDYRHADYWKEFSNIKISETITVDGIAYDLNMHDLTAVVGDNAEYAEEVATTLPEVEYEDVIFPVIAVSNYAFQNNSNIVSVRIAEGVQTIGKQAFKACGSLESINLPASVASLGSQAMAVLSSLKSISCMAPVPPVALDEDPFLSTPKSANIYVQAANVEDYKKDEYWGKFTNISDAPTSVNALIDGIRYQLDFVTLTATVLPLEGESKYSGDVVIPASVKYDAATYAVTAVGKEAFYSCAELSSISIPDGVTAIGVAAFLSCSGLTKLTLPASVTSIDQVAFYGCTGLTTLTCEAITPPALGPDVFNYNLESIPVYVPDASVSTYEASTAWTTYFKNIQGMTDAPSGKCGENVNWELKDGVLTISGTGDMANFSADDVPWAKKRITITSVIIEEGVTRIGQCAFFQCTNMTSVSIPNSVMYINASSFAHCSALTSLTIPGNVADIQGFAFGDCSGLTAITCKAATPPTMPTEYGPFEGVDKSIPVVVPDASVKAYKEADGWKDFTNLFSPAELEAAKTRLQKLIGEYGALAAVADKLGNTAIKSILESQALAHSAKLTSNDIEVLNGEINSCLTELNGYISLLLPAAKAQVNDGLEALLLPTDSEACKKIIADAQAAINALEWSEEHTVAMIVSEATAIASQAEADLKAQRSKEAGEETGLNDVQSDRVQSTKVLINGQLFILRGEQLFDTNGRQVR